MESAVVTWIVVGASFAGGGGAASDHELHEGLVHRHGGGRALAIDVRVPREPRGERPFVVLLGDGAAGTRRDDPELRRLAEACVAEGLASAVAEFDPGSAARDLESAIAFLGREAPRLRLAPASYGVHAVGAAVQGALDACMEHGLAAAALSLQSGAGYVIEGLRGDLPLLLLESDGDPVAIRRGLRELAHQAELCGESARRCTPGGDAPREAAAFHRRRLLPPPSDRAAVDDPDEALDLARVASERGDEAGSIAWLERAFDLEEIDPAAVRLDGGFARIRTRGSFRAWIGDRSTASRVALVRDEEPGRRITIRGRVVERGAPVAGARLDLWQTDDRGVYAPEGGDDDARIHGSLVTDADGRFEVATIRPSGYPKTMIPAHIHVRVSRAGRRDRALEFLFDDDPRMVPSTYELARRLDWPVVRLDDEGKGEVEVAFPR